MIETNEEMLHRVFSQCNELNKPKPITCISFSFKPVVRGVRGVINSFNLKRE